MTGPTEAALKHVDIHFSDLTYRIKNKCLLHGINGQFFGGQLTGILGTSGAGKSTLLNILAGQVRYGTEGSICINGKPRDDKLFHKISSYIMQDDILQPRLSVKELMNSAASLKIGAHHTQRMKDNVVEDVLVSMGLENVKDVRTEHLSGGQKKRLCIALELVNNPPVIFLDEPTTGLDDVSTKQCIALLKSLANKGKTIICTIHQPSNTIFEQFDQVYFLSEGNCVYSGDTKDIVPFLRDVGMPCPDFYNPADYLIELVNVEKYAGVLKIQNDRDREIKAQDKSYRGYVNPYYIDGVTSYIFAVSFWHQFWTLLQRKILQIGRARVTMSCEIGHHFLCGLIIGLIFYDRGNNGKHLVDNIKLYYGICIYFMFSHGMLVALLFPAEVALLQREYFNRWYSLKAYYLAMNLSMLPVSCTGAVIFSSLVYFMSGQPIETDRVLLFLTVSLVYVIASQGFGFVIGSLFNPVNGACVGSAVGMILILLSSYNMGSGEITNPTMKILTRSSYAYHAYVGFGMTAFKNRQPVDCPDIFCLFSDPETLLQQVGMEHMTIHMSIAYLLLFTALHRILAYGFLKCRLKPDSVLHQILK